MIIACWSGPRNISTALMRSWSSRKDTFVTDEPFYAYYLKETKLKHPMYKDIINTYSSNYNEIVNYLINVIPQNKKIWYQKHMAHHILDSRNIDWIANCENCILSLFMGQSNFHFSNTNSSEKSTALTSMYSFLRIVMSRDLVPTWWPPVAPKSEQAWQRRNQLAVGDRITAASMSTLRNLLFAVFQAEFQRKIASTSKSSLPLERMRAYMLDKLRKDIGTASLRKYSKF